MRVTLVLVGVAEALRELGCPSSPLSSLLPQICHTLTEKLVAMTMGSGAKMKTSASVSDIIVVAKRISPR